MTAHIYRELERLERARERAERKKREDALALVDRHLEPDDIERWFESEYFLCPGYDRRYTCRDPKCLIGTACMKMAAKGLWGDGTALPKKIRPRCGAKTRTGGECQATVVPGKRRCRLHGGLSTGPKTEAGKERIRRANIERWKRNYRLRKRRNT